MVCISGVHIFTKCTYYTFGAAPNFGGNIPEALHVDLASTDLHTFVTTCFQLITEHFRKHSLIHVRTITPSYAIECLYHLIFTSLCSIQLIIHNSIVSIIYL